MRNFVTCLALIGLITPFKVLIGQNSGEGLTFIGELAEVDWSKSEVKDSVDLQEILLKCRDGQDSLRLAIQSDPKSYPLHELENPNVHETDEHRRWEYQMKRMPVIPVVVKNIDEHIKVDLTFEPEFITVCSTSSVTGILHVANSSEIQIPSFMIGFQPIPGLSLREAKVVSKSSENMRLQQTGKRDVRYNVSSLNPKEEFYVSLKFVVDCNGAGGSPALISDTLMVSPEYLIDFIGYQLDYSERELYKLFGKARSNSKLMLTRDGKTEN